METLPLEIVDLIYEYDGRYKEQFKKLINSMNKYHEIRNIYRDFINIYKCKTEIEELIDDVSTSIIRENLCSYFEAGCEIFYVVLGGVKIMEFEKLNTLRKQLKEYQLNFVTSICQVGTIGDRWTNRKLYQNAREKYILYNYKIYDNNYKNIFYLPEIDTYYYSDDDDYEF